MSSPSITEARGCPLCDRPTDPAHAPFCGRGCKDRDLLRWLGEGYAVPGRPADEEGLDSPSAPIL